MAYFLRKLVLMKGCYTIVVIYIYIYRKTTAWASSKKYENMAAVIIINTIIVV